MFRTVSAPRCPWAEAGDTAGQNPCPRAPCARAVRSQRLLMNAGVSRERATLGVLQSQRGGRPERCREPRRSGGGKWVASWRWQGCGTTWDVSRALSPPGPEGHGLRAAHPNLLGTFR